MLAACTGSGPGGGPSLTVDKDAGGKPDPGGPPDAAAELPMPVDIPSDPGVEPPDVPGTEADGVVEPPDEGPPDIEEPDVDAGAPDPGPPPDPGSEPDVYVPPVDCSAIPAGPFVMTKLNGMVASEDIAFDRNGHAVGANDKAIFKNSYAGKPQVFVPDMKFRAGMRYLPNGHLIVCDNVKGQLVRVDENGVKYPLMTGLSYPNGITVDMKGWIYFSEHDANVVWRVHPFTGDATVMTKQITSPNGLTFSPDYKTLYIDGFNGNPKIYAMSVSPDGIPGKLVVLTELSTGWHDGMGVDACGNIYVADYNETRIYRISPDGKKKEMIIDGSSYPNAYLPNMDWGSGIGGWDPLALYIPDGWQKGIFEVKIGVPAKPRPYP